QRGALAKYFVVVGAFASVGQIEAVRVSDPMLLRVLAAERFAIIEAPALRLGIMEAIIAGRYIRVGIGPEREIILSIEFGNRRLVEPGADTFSAEIGREFAAVFFIRERLAVKPATQNGHVINFFGTRA